MNDDILTPLFAPLSGDVHIDLETTGLEWWLVNSPQHITALGVAWEGGNFCIDVRDFDKPMWEYVLTRLAECNLYAFNAPFDFGWLYRQCHNLGLDGNPIIKALKGCSATLYRGLANEGYKGQRSSLGVVQEDFLQWKNVNKEWLSQALHRHGLAKANMSELIDLEPEDFLYYCAIDAEASLQAWEELVEQAGELKLKFFRTEEMLQIKELIMQQWHGMFVNRPSLYRHQTRLKFRKWWEHKKFRNHEETKEAIDKWEWENCTPTTRTDIVTRKVIAKKADQPWLQPEEWQQDTQRSNLKKWEKEHGAWCKYVDEEKTTTLKPKYAEFNINSNKQLVWLFYETLYKYEIVGGDWRDSVNLHVGNRTVNLDLTAGGGLPVGREVYPALGKAGKVLARYNKLEKELGYVSKALKVSEADSRIHPGFIAYGTKTGRLAASGGYNMQQQPKSKDYLSCFVPDPGYVFVDVDVTSLEPTVQAEFSRDKTLIDIYASGKSHDLYLWWARFIHPDSAFRKKLQAEYEPSPDAIEKLKKKYKKERSFIKAPVLGFSYGMGPRKLFKSLNIQGYDVTLEDCRLTYYNYWDKLKGVKAWEEELLREWEYRGGWIKNAFGHPISLPENYKKDIINKFTQNSGHCVLQILNKHVVALLDERKLYEVPIVQDFHDERISMCREDDAPKLVEIFNEAFVRLNEELNPSIQFKGVPEIGYSIWDFKK